MNRSSTTGISQHSWDTFLKNKWQGETDLIVCYKLLQFHCLHWKAHYTSWKFGSRHFYDCGYPGVDSQGAALMDPGLLSALGFTSMAFMLVSGMWVSMLNHHRKRNALRSAEQGNPTLETVRTQRFFFDEKRGEGRKKKQSTPWLKYGQNIEEPGEDKEGGKLHQVQCWQSLPCKAHSCLHGWAGSQELLWG